MNPEIATWKEQAITDVHYEGSRAEWQNRYLALYKELEKANKIIDALLK